MWPPTSSSVPVNWNGQPAFWQGRACHQTPDDLWNFAEAVCRLAPSMVLEVGTGEGGTSSFLSALGVSTVTSVDIGDPMPTIPSGAFVMLDGDVYSHDAMFSDLDRYSPHARWVVVCHTNRKDWGAASALDAWLPAHPEWTVMSVRHPTQHTWLQRCPNQS